MNDFHIGRRVLERYRVVQPLGSGGMGVVYLGRTEGAAGFTRPVVIKRLRASLAGEREHNEMFAREARILSNLQHPNIVSIVDFGLERGEYVMVLEYVHGYDLDQWSNYVWRMGRQHPADHALLIARKVLSALHYAHSLRRPDGTLANIVHRDVSLSNVLLDALGMVKLHDFGIARMEGSDEAQTETGVFKGKLALAAPELLNGDRATPRSDIYSLGVITYQLLCGINPFRGKDPSNTMYRVLHHTPPPLAACRDDLPEGLDEVLGRALHKDLDQRFADAAEFAHALAGLCTRPDEDVLEEMSRQLTKDFERIPIGTDLGSLSTRDAAWRDAQVASEAAPLPLSSSPPARRPEAPGALVSTLPPTRPATAEPASPTPGALPTSTPGALPTSTAVEPAPRSPARKLRRWALGTAALALVGAAGTVLARRSPPDPSTRYVVIEKPPAPSPAAEVSSTGFVASPPGSPTPPVASGAGPGTGPNKPASPSSNAPSPNAPSPNAPSSRPSASRPDAATLTREFRRHRPRVEACIGRHVDQIERHPQISIRFEVNTAGKVTNAELSPQSLTGTPLGTCILGVARSVQFSPVSKPVAFSIPITVRAP